MASVPFISFFASNWEAGCSLLTDDEEFLYFKICRHIWDTGKHLDEVDIPHLFKEPKPWLDDALAGLFRHEKIERDDDGKIFNKKAVKSHREALNRVKVAKHAASKRWKNKKKTDNADVVQQHVGEQSGSNKEAMLSTPTSTTTSTKKENIPDRAESVAAREDEKGSQNDPVSEGRASRSVAPSARSAGGGNGQLPLKRMNQRVDFTDIDNRQAYARQKCRQALGDDATAFRIVDAASDPGHPEHASAVERMKKTARRLKLTWYSPAELSLQGGSP